MKRRSEDDGAYTRRAARSPVMMLTTYRRHFGDSRNFGIIHGMPVLQGKSCSNEYFQVWFASSAPEMPRSERKQFSAG
jgi:hypothetical protein